MASKSTSQYNPVTPTLGFYSLNQILDLYPISRATLYREIKEKRFPAQTKLTRHRVGWAKASVDIFLAQRAGIAA
jgi:predicted DNA-binding transcriptional regulator AlpA